MIPESTLKTFFGFQDFRHGQKEIVDSILSGKDTLALLPTGGGKSICFQVPGLIMKNLSLVVSPLISLMIDQVHNLQKRNIPTSCIHSGLDKEQLKKIFSEILSNKYKFVYVSPERLANDKFLRLCQQITISQLVIDEAHCISMWGNDFRPSYKRIPEFVSKLENRPVMSAFTATATRKVVNDIASSLQLNKPAIFYNSFSRKNLNICVYRCASHNQKILALIYLLQKHFGQSGIIYTATREDTKQVVDIVRKFSWNEKLSKIKIEYYHGALSAERRKKVQELFLCKKLQVISTTNAFGMGIDQPDIRFIIHYQIPGNLENYYQEIGRAGRDGNDSRCYLLFFPYDVTIQQEMINSNKKITIARKNYLFNQLKQMIYYAENKQCLHRFILKYFGEHSTANCEIRCNHCTKERHLKINFEQDSFPEITHNPSLNLPNLTEEQLIYCQLLQPKKLEHFLTIPGIGAAWRQVWLSSSRENMVE
ncbi:MAG: RecQ family ATP-dependent DNA helicase [Patescibacteria group bacterium]